MRSLQQLLHQLSYWCFGALIFFIPSNLFVKLSPHTGYVHGIQVDYLLPKLYLSDVCIVLLLALWCGEVMVKKRGLHVLFRQQWHLPFIIIGYVALRGILTPFPLAAGMTVLSYMKALLLFFWVQHHSTIVRSSLFHVALIGMMMFQSLLGLYQFTTQHALAPYQMLGETQIQRQIGIPKVDFSFVDSIFATHLGERLLPHGTTPHPNILAGIFAIGLIIIWQRDGTKSTKYIITVLTLTTLLLTFSLSAWLTLLITVIISIPKLHPTFSKATRMHWIILGIILLVIPLCLWVIDTYGLIDSPSIHRRVVLNSAALTLFQRHPLFGVGPNQFTATMESALSSTEVVRFVQPVHHIPLLLLSEQGLMGTLVLGTILWKTCQWKKRDTQTFNTSLWKTAVILTPIIALDHYLVTTQQGMFLILMLLFLSQYDWGRGDESP